MYFGEQEEKACTQTALWMALIFSKCSGRLLDGRLRLTTVFSSPGFDYIDSGGKTPKAFNLTIIRQAE